MAKKRVTRKELLKGPDEFLTSTGRALLFFRAHSRAFSYVGMGIVVAALIYLGINTFMGYMNKKGQAAYNEAYYTLSKSMSPNMDAENLQEPLESFQRVVDKYGLSKASRLAFPEMAYLKFLDKKYDEAIPLYEEFLGKASHDDIPYQSLARMALAACYEAKGEFRQAIEILIQVNGVSDGFLKEQAMLSLARVYRLTDQLDKSKEILEQFIEKFTTSPYLPIAKAHLEDLKP
jgi:outer membrane protein assembly factor BamD (BamD/ComL family)